MARPYDHPDNVGSNGQPKMSEDAWAVYEQLREEKDEDSSWGLQLLKAIEGKLSQEDFRQALAILQAGPTQADIQTIVAELQKPRLTLADIQPVLAWIGGVQAAFGSVENLMSSLNISAAKCDALMAEKAAKTDEVTTPDATDLASALTLVNELKAKLNVMNA